MRSKTLFGALLVSVALCSQGFGFELLDRMLGLNGGGCGECNACTKVKACEPCAKVCCPEPACCAKPTCCEKERVCRPTPVRDLFAGLKDLFTAKGCVCEEPACKPCEPACKPCEPACKACEPACKPCEPACREKPCKVRCHKVRACEPACKACEPACKACEPACKPCEPACEPAKPKCHKLYRRPVLELLEKLFCCDERNDECGCSEATCGGTTVPSQKAPTTAPAKAPEKAAPLPQAPKADPSASNTNSRGIYQASRSLVRN